MNISSFELVITATVRQGDALLMMSLLSFKILKCAPIVILMKP